MPIGSEPTDPPDEAPAPPGAPPTPVRRTATTPESERAGLVRPNVVVALMAYDTDEIHLLPREIRKITLGVSPKATPSIRIEGENVSTDHCRLERQERKGELLRFIDLKSKNGTFLDGERVPRGYLRPGQVLSLGSRSRRFVALNEQMHHHLSALRDILGTEIEHRDERDRQTPSPSDLIVIAVGGAPLLIIAEPDCEQDRLATVIHEMSRLRERPIVRQTPLELPRDRKAQLELVAQQAARSTLVLDLLRWNERDPVDPHLVQLLQRPRYQVRTIVLAKNRDQVGAALSWSFEERLGKIWLRPIVERPQAIDRLLDRMFELAQSPLRVAYFTTENQEALRSYSWPENFAELRRGAVWLTAIARNGSVHAAAHALGVPPARIYSWLSALRFNYDQMFRSAISFKKSKK